MNIKCDNSDSFNYSIPLYLYYYNIKVNYNRPTEINKHRDPDILIHFNDYNDITQFERENTHQRRIEYSRNRYLNLSEDLKNEVREKARNKYHTISDEELQKHKEYQKNYQKIYREKKNQELQNSKKEQDNFDKNAVLTPPKT